MLKPLQFSKFLSDARFAKLCTAHTYYLTFFVVLSVWTEPSFVFLSLKPSSMQGHWTELYSLNSTDCLWEQIERIQGPVQVPPNHVEFNDLVISNKKGKVVSGLWVDVLWQVAND